MSNTRLLDEAAAESARIAAREHEDHLDQPARITNRQWQFLFDTIECIHNTLHPAVDEEE